MEQISEGTRPRRLLVKRVAIGCAGLILLGLLPLLWIGFQIYQTTRPVELSEHHPFRSPAKKDLYLAHYDHRALPWPSPSTTRMVETSWGETFVRINGPSEGLPLVLVPGANATSVMWLPNIEALSREHRVYALDAIYDVGRSVHTRHVKTSADMVEWLVEVLEGLGLYGEVRLVGMSYGGWVASRFALAHPQRVEKLVLVAPAATVLPFSGDFIKRGLLCMIPHKRFVREMIHWALADAAAGSDEHRRFVDEAVDDAWISLRSFKPRPQVHPTVLSDDELMGLSPSTFYLVGENEVIYSGSAADAVARLNSVAPEITTEILPDCGHDLTLVQADLVNERILGFLGSHPVAK